jgi:hypothetical protein
MACVFEGRDTAGLLTRCVKSRSELAEQCRLWADHSHPHPRAGQDTPLPLDGAFSIFCDTLTGFCATLKWFTGCHGKNSMSTRYL